VVSAAVRFTCVPSEKKSVLQCVGVCWSVLECVGVRWRVLECVGVCCNKAACVIRITLAAVWKEKRIAVCCSVLQCVAVCCSVLQ